MIEVGNIANQEHLEILKQGMNARNEWRKKHPEVLPDFSNATLNGCVAKKKLICYSKEKRAKEGPLWVLSEFRERLVLDTVYQVC
jgi:hypothetical protein